MSASSEYRTRSRRISWKSPALVLVAMPFVGLLLVLLASMVPDAWVLASLLDAVDAGNVTRDQFGPGTSGRTMDYFTDCIGTTIGLGDGPDGSQWTNAVRSPTLGSCVSSVDRLEQYRTGGGLESAFEYFRYWHGYTVVTRPLIALVGLAATRMIVLWAMIAVAVGLAHQLTRAHGWRVAVALMLPVMLTTDLVDLPRSLPHACGAIAALSAAWVAHRSVSSADAAVLAPAVAVLAVSAGAMFLFFDILTIVPGAWALFVAAVMLAASEQRSGRALASTGAIAAAGWIVGWAWMWMTKWVFAALVVGVDDVRANISDAAGERLDGDVAWLDFSFGNSIQLTFSTWFDHPLTLVVLLLLAVLVGLTWIQSTVLRRRAGDRLVLMVPAVIPLVWFEVMRNHSQVHAGFSYRSWAMVAGIVAAAAVVVLSSPGDDSSNSSTS